MSDINTFGKLVSTTIIGLAAGEPIIMSDKPLITTAQFLEIGSNNDFDAAEKLFNQFDSLSLLAQGEQRWGKNFGQRGYMHSTDHRAALLKIKGKEPSWLEIYDSWASGDGNITQAFLMEPDDGSLSYCLIRSFNSVSRGLREWNYILSTGKLSNGRELTGECAKRMTQEPPGPVEPPVIPPVEPPIDPIDPPVIPTITPPTTAKPFTLSARSLETLKTMIQWKTIGPGRLARLQKLKEEIESQLKD